MTETWRCPSCGRVLRAEREAFVATERLVVYECPCCVDHCDCGARTVDLPLTFAVDTRGRVVRFSADLG